MVTWKYIIPVDENIAIDIYVTTRKFFKQCVWSVMGKAGFYNFSHTTFEHRASDPKSEPTHSQSDNTTTPESNFASSPTPTCNRKRKEASDENPNDIQW